MTRMLSRWELLCACCRAHTAMPGGCTRQGWEGECGLSPPDRTHLSSTTGSGKARVVRNQSWMVPKMCDSAAGEAWGQQET